MRVSQTFAFAVVLWNISVDFAMLPQEEDSEVTGEEKPGFGPWMKADFIPR